jgi:Tfp pilus assembly protein PilO
MLKNLTYKKKFLYLVVGGVLLLCLVYTFSINETLKLRSSYIELKNRYDGVFDASSSILFYEKELNKIDSLMVIKNDKGNYTQEALLRKVTEFGRAHNLTIINFPAPHQFIENGYKINTYEASISGSFNDLLRLLYELEVGNYPGVIKSTNFELTKSSNQSRTMLVLTLFIQEIKDIKEIKDEKD